MKKTKMAFLLIGLLLVICASSLPKVNAQPFSYSIRATWVKMDVTRYSRKIVLVPKNYSNGFEIGPLVTYRPKPSPFAFTTGILYTTLHNDSHSNYNLNFLNVPLQFSIEAGKKAGVFLGFGVRFWYLLKVPENLIVFEERGKLNRFLFSWTGHIGAFFTVKKLRFQIFPQVEFFKTPLYYSTDWRNSKYEHFINMVSYNLTVSF